MRKEHNRKIKLLKLWEILIRNTDEEHPLSTNEILELLKSEDIKIERKTLYADIQLLNSCGYEIMCIKHRSNCYYTEDRKFQLPELRILLDAVQAANFISEKKTAELAEKIALQAGKSRSEFLLQNIACYNTTKCRNQAVYYNVDAITNAIVLHKKLSFRYFDYAINKSRVYRRGGNRYIMTPVQLV